MCIAWRRLGLLLLAGYCLGAPYSRSEVETDPELTAGYFEGDMEVAFQRNGEMAATRHWPNGVIYYKIDKAFDPPYADYIELGMKLIERVSCVRFVPATEDTINYVLITTSETGCSSNVGIRGGQQTLKLKPQTLDVGCFRLGTIQHELLHTLGFHHQQCSANRDSYVKIIEENIIKGKENNFKKYGTDRVDNYDISYDYGSVLHYSAKAFSNNGEDTIVALQPEGQALMGQRLALSSADIDRLNTMYKCPILL